MAYDFCEDLAFIDNIGVECNLAKGYESTGYIIEKSKLKSYTTDADNKTLLTALTVEEGSKFKYIGQLKNAFSDTTVSLNQGTYRNSFTNTVSFKVFDNSAEITKVINGLANGEYVMVLEQKFKDHTIEVGGEDVDHHSTYRVFGLEQGLSASAIDQDNYSDDQGCGWSVSLEEVGSSSAAYYLVKEAFTEALFPKP